MDVSNRHRCLDHVRRTTSSYCSECLGAVHCSRRGGVGRTVVSDTVVYCGVVPTTAVARSGNASRHPDRNGSQPSFVTDRVRRRHPACILNDTVYSPLAVYYANIPYVRVFSLLRLVNYSVLMKDISSGRVLLPELKLETWNCTRKSTVRVVVMYKVHANVYIVRK